MASQPSAAQRGWTGAVPVSGGTRHRNRLDCAICPRPAPAEVELRHTGESKTPCCPIQQRICLGLPSVAQRAATGGEQGIGLLSMKWGRAV